MKKRLLMPEAILQRRKMMDFPSSPGGAKTRRSMRTEVQAFSRGKGGEKDKRANSKQ